MGLSFKNRQVAGNICLVVFLAFMFTLLPGQLFTGQAFATPANEIAINASKISSNANTNQTDNVNFTVQPVTSDFTTTIGALINKIESNVNNLIYKVTYSKVGTAVYSVYLWYYAAANGGSIADNTYSWVYGNAVGQVKDVTLKVWSPPDNTGDHGGNSTTTPVTPVTPATPAVPGVTPAKPASPASVVAKLATYKPTVAQGKFLNAINEDVKEDKYLKNAPQASNVLITVGKAKLMIPKLIITSAKVFVIMPLTSNKLDPKAVNYKIAMVKNFLTANGITNIPVRFVFVNPNPKLKVNVKPGSYFKVATEETLVATIKSSFVNKKVVGSKSKIIKAFGIKK